MKDLPLKELLRLYSEKKMSSGKIAEKYGCCKATVLKRLRGANASLRPAGVPRLETDDEQLGKLYVDKKLSTWKIAELLGCGRSTIHRKIAKLGLARDSSCSHLKYERKPFSGNEAEKAYLLGFAIGDLRVRKVGKASKTIKIDCGSTKSEQIELIRSMFSDYGRVWVGKPRCGKTQIEAFLDDSFDFLLDGRKKMGWAIQRENFLPFLAGFTDAEGSVFITNGKAGFSVGNYDRKLLGLLKKGLEERGVEHVHLYRARKKYPIAGGHMQRQHYWHMIISRKGQLLKLFNMLGSHIRHKKRKEDMQKAMKNIADRNSKNG